MYRPRATLAKRFQRDGDRRRQVADFHHSLVPLGNRLDEPHLVGHLVKVALHLVEIFALLVGCNQEHRRRIGVCLADRS